jgi:hypothetical protein
MAVSIFQQMKERWPSPVVARTSIREFSGGSLQEKYIANLDSKGEGPPGRIRLGRKIVYPVDELVKWMEGRMRPVRDEDKTIVDRIRVKPVQK